MQKAQVSLEYLLVLSGAIAALLFLLPSVSFAVKTIVFSIDSVSAKQFSRELQSTVEEMRFLADGTKREITAKPIGKWRFSSAEKKLFVSVLFDDGKEKTFEIETPTEFFIDFTIVEKTVFTIKKENNQILIENN